MITKPTKSPRKLETKKPEENKMLETIDASESMEENKSNTLKPVYRGQNKLKRPPILIPRKNKTSSSSTILIKDTNVTNKNLKK